MPFPQSIPLAAATILGLIAILAAPAAAQSPICASLSPGTPAYAIYGCGASTSEQQDELIESIEALAVERVEAEAFGQIEANEFNSDLLRVFDVPTGKVLVVEYVTVEATVRDNPGAGVPLFARLSGDVIGVLEKTGSLGGLGGLTDVIGKNVRILNSSGLNFLLSRPDKDPVNAVSFRVRISGFLEDVAP